MIRIAIPSVQPGGLDAEVGAHFGHCDLYTLVDVDDNNQKRRSFLLALTNMAAASPLSTTSANVVSTCCSLAVWVCVPSWASCRLASKFSTPATLKPWVRLWKLRSLVSSRALRPTTPAVAVVTKLEAYHDFSHRDSNA